MSRFGRPPEVYRMPDDGGRSAGRAWRWWVCVALLFATLLNYMDRQALAVSLPVLKRTLGLHEGRVGTLEMAFGLAFAGGSLLFGWLADRVGPRRLYPLVLAGWSLAGAAAALAAVPDVTAALESADDEPGAGAFRWLLVCRTLLGLCEAGHWPCALLTVRDVLSADERPLGNGLLQSGASLGAVLVPGYVAMVESAGFGWPMTFASVGAAGLLWLPAWAVLMASGGRPPVDSATRRRPVTDQGADAPRSPRTGLVRELAVLGVVVGCLTVSWQFLRAWLPLFLEDNQGFSKDATRLVTAGYFLASDVGCVGVGLLVGRLVGRGWTIGTARRAAFVLFAGLAAAAAIVPHASAGWMTVALLWAAGAGVLGLHPLYYALTQELPAARMGALAGGLAAVGWVASAVFQQFVGTWVRETQSYAVGLTIAGAAPLIAVTVVIANHLTAGRRRPG